MTVEPPQPPTAPAPAVRPTPPTPPRIDMSPFKPNADNETQEPSDAAPNVNRKVDDPESMARDAVAHGGGSLTKRTVTHGDDGNEQSAPPNQTVTVIPPDAPLVSNEQSDYDRGQDVLRQFKEMDARDSQPSQSPPAQTATEQPFAVAPSLNYHEGHGVVYWLFAIVFVAVASFIIVKKFLLTDKPALTKSQLFEDSAERLKAATDKIKPARQLNTSKVSATDKVKSSAPPPKPALLPKKDDDRGKHFEVRV